MTVARALTLSLMVEYGRAMHDATARLASQDWCQRLHRAGIDTVQDEDARH